MAAGLVLSGRSRVWRSERALLAAVESRENGPARPSGKQAEGLVVTEHSDAPWPTVEFVREQSLRAPTVLFLHGGGYVFDLASRHWDLLTDLARRSGWRFVVPRYPLAPEGSAAAIVPNAVALARRLQRGGPLVLSGDSAGGGMALATALGLRDVGLPGVPLLLIAPWLDVTMTDPSVAANAKADPWLAPPGLAAAGALYRGDLPAEHPIVSPIFGDLAGIGPITLFSGTRDVLNGDSRRLVSAARAAGVSVWFDEAPGMLHNYPLLPIRAAAAARRAMLAALVRAADPAVGGAP